MSNQSPLRQEIVTIMNSPFEYQLLHESNMGFEIDANAPNRDTMIDAILDVLIHALPEGVDMLKYGIPDEGYETAINDVKNLLLEAKGTK